VEYLLKRQINMRFCAVIMVMMCFLSSCTMETTGPQEYIGPAVRVPEPNAQAQAVKETQIPKGQEANIPKTGPLSVTINEAVFMSLARNKSLIVQKLNPQIQSTFEEQAISVFDPNLRASFSDSRINAKTVPRPGLGSFSSLSKEFDADVSLNQFLPMGTILSLDGSTSDLTGSFLNEPFVSSRVGGSLTQPLLRGFGSAVNLVSVNQARIDTKISQYELRGFVEALVAEVENTYWNYLLVEKDVGIFKESLKIAEDQQKETEEMIRVGKTAASELVTAKAEVALRREELIAAENTAIQTRLNLLKLLNPDGAEMWEMEIVLQSKPEETLIETGPVQSYVETAMRMRPEMNQAKLQLERNELELVRTRNGLLPELDFFITLGSTGYASTFNRSVKDIFTGDYDILTGVSFGISPINREARAQHSRAMLSRQQAEEAINNLAQTVEVDVRGTYLQIMSARQQVEAAKASRELQEEKLKIETAKFKVGKSIMLLVAQAQRDFLQSQIAEIQAIINYQVAVVEFYRLEGTLLLRRGIASPGSEPVISKTAAK